MHRIREYVKQSSIHGFHYIADNERHWSERLFWVLVCSLSIYYTGLFLREAFYDFNHNAVSFVVETDYLDWNTTFPAISICEQESPDKLEEISQRLYGNERDMNIDFYLRDIAFFDGACYSCAQCSSHTMHCSEDYNYIISKIKEKCSGLIGNCTWNGVQFPCCDNFLPLLTESGLCYTINSIQTKRKWNTLPKLVSNRRIGPGTLKLNAYESVKVYIHSPEDVPYVNHVQDEKFLINWGSDFILKIQVREIENDRNLPLVNIEQRKCRLPEENHLSVYNYYSYTACMVDCRSKAQITLCNCTSHYIPHNSQDGVVTCGIKGLICLTSHVEVLRSLQPSVLKKHQIEECNCLSSCNEPEYSVIFSDIDTKKFANGTSEIRSTEIIIGLERLPTERYKRNVVRTRLDLLVSIGSTVGLFLGASFLSFLELLYYLFIRMHKFDINKVKIIDTQKKTNAALTWKFGSISPKTSSLFFPNPRLIRPRTNDSSNKIHIF